MLNPILISRLYILRVCKRASNSFFFANSLTSSIYIRCLIFSYEFEKLYPPVHFIRMRLSGILIIIITSHGKSASTWKIPHWIFPSGKLFSPVVRSIFQFFMTSEINFMTLSDILFIFIQTII